MRAHKNTCVAYLTAAFRIERRVVKNNLAFLTRPQHIDHRAIEYERGNPRSASHSGTAGETGLAGQLDRLAQISAEFARCLGSAALRFHGNVECRLIDGETSFTCDVGGQIRGKSIGIVKLEYRFARDDGRF